MWRVLTSVLVVLVLASGCSNDGTEDTELGESLAPTEVALAADEAFRSVPGGYDDCGATVLTSGWPTTTIFNPEVSARCIVNAADSGISAQYATWGRDGVGGIVGTIIRVNGPGDITFIEYGVDADGNVDSADTPCQRLTVESFEPPGCDSN